MIKKRKYTLEENLLFNDFFSIPNDCLLACYNQHNIFETYHVADGFEEVTDSLAEIVKEFILNYGSSKENVDNHNDLIYTGYNFDWMYYKTMKQNIKNGDEPTPVLYTDDKSYNYPIYLEMFWDEGETYIDFETKEEKQYGDYANAYYRDSNDETFKKIIIRINVFCYRYINGNKTYLLLKSTIAHELQHVFDMYILPDRNQIETNIHNGITIDYSDNIFDIQDKIDYINIKSIITMMSQEERNARLAELNSLIKNIIDNPDLCDEIFYDKIKNKLMISIIKTMDTKTETLTDKSLFNRIAYNPFIQSVTRVNFYKTVISEIIKYKVSNPDKFKQYMLIIGYYMYKHSMFKLILSDDEKKQLRRILSDEDTVKKYMNKDCDWICNFIYNSIRNRFSEYVCYVNGTLMKYIHNFYNYKFIKEVYGIDYIAKSMIPVNSIILTPLCS